MYPPSRARRNLKRIGVGLSLFLLILWIVSLGYGVALVPSPTIYMHSDRGELCLAYVANGLNSTKTWSSVSSEVRRRSLDLSEFAKLYFHYGPLEGPSSAPVTLIIVPIRLLLLLTAIPTAWLLHRDRRSRRIGLGCCLRCGYDLTGNTSGVCSECGAAKPKGAADATA